MKLTPSVLSLLAVNSIPLFGVVFLGWNLSLIIFLYWFENFVYGFYSVLKILSYNKQFTKGITVKINGEKKILTSPHSIAMFFVVQFGIFSALHGLAVFSLFINDLNVNGSLLLTIILLFVSHGISYSRNFKFNKEHEAIDANKLLMAPYKRIIIMHLTIILTGMVVKDQVSTSLIPLIVLVGLKTVIDVFAHISEHTNIFKKRASHTLHLPDKLSDKILSIPGFEEHARKAFEKSVNTGKWDEIKKDLDPDTVRYIEEYYKTK